MGVILTCSSVVGSTQKKGDVLIDMELLTSTSISLHTLMNHSNEPFVLPTQTTQVYYTPTLGRKRDRPPANWQVVIHTSTRRREEVIGGDVYQEQTLHRPNVVNVDDDEVIQLDDENEAHEIDPELLLVEEDIDTDNEELLTDTDTEIDTDEDDGYESAKEDDSDSDSSDNGT